jgi:Ca2+-binding RTX toxin-like protein
VNPTGSGLVYSTYLGGRRLDESFGVALNPGGDAYVTGFSFSKDFPTTPGASPFNEAFVTVLDAAGASLLYSQRFGAPTGQGNELGLGIAVDENGDAYVAGQTTAPGFRTTSGAFDRTYNGGDDGFVIKLSPGEALLCEGLAPTILGTDESDRLVGTPGDDVINGFDGDDVILGVGGEDVICGGNGDDLVRAGVNNDLISGGPGNDTIYGNGGRDTIRCDFGDDQLFGGPGFDVLSGSQGSDVLDGGDDNDRCDGGQDPDSAVACETVVNVP